MRILVLNSGSSSIKFRLLDVESTGSPPEPHRGTPLLQGSIKGIGGIATLDLLEQGRECIESRRESPSHDDALRWLFESLEQSRPEDGNARWLTQVEAVGHRVVHGGERFDRPVLIDAAVEGAIDMLSELAPLHNPACLMGIRAARSVLGPGVPMVAVFDTSFHQTMPAAAQSYALPHDLTARHHLRRYGFHGSAHASLASGYAACTGRALDGCRLITLQLGNGCSATAIDAGRSVETSMGFTPLEGLVMGTRSGDLDPSVVSCLVRREEVDAAEVERWLNERSGLLGVSGRTNDMRELLRAAMDEGDSRARLAIDLFCHRARKYIGAYLAVLEGADAVVFGGGIGEGSPDIRARICDGMGWCGLSLDRRRNEAATDLEPGGAARISSDDAKLEVYVVAADEESWIASETVRCLCQSGF